MLNLKVFRGAFNTSSEPGLCAQCVSWKEAGSESLLNGKALLPLRADAAHCGLCGDCPVKNSLHLSYKVGKVFIIPLQNMLNSSQALLKCQNQDQTRSKLGLNKVYTRITSQPNQEKVN